MVLQSLRNQLPAYVTGLLVQVPLVQLRVRVQVLLREKLFAALRARKISVPPVGSGVRIEILPPHETLATDGAHERKFAPVEFQMEFQIALGLVRFIADWTRVLLVGAVGDHVRLVVRNFDETDVAYRADRCELLVVFQAGVVLQFRRRGEFL